MFDDKAMFELLDRLGELFYSDVQTVGDQTEMENLAAEIAARVKNSSYA